MTGNNLSTLFVNTTTFSLSGFKIALSYCKFFTTFNFLKSVYTFLSSISNILNVKAHKLVFKRYIDISSSL